MPEPTFMKPDLHCHSTYSDGKHNLDFLTNEARQKGVTHLAITDHDCIAAFKNGQNDYEDVQLIPGVEISTLWQGIELHIVGLDVSPQCPELNALLEAQQQRRWQRIEGMSEKLEKLGVSGLTEYVQNLDCVAASRSHVADFLVEKGVCKTRQKAFKTHLGKKGKAWVPSHWCDLSEALVAIQAANGISVIAHCSRYPLNKSKRRALVEEFAGMGGGAVEVSYPNLEPNMRKELVMLADENDLRYSIGSDFHDKAATWTSIGKFQGLSSTEESRAVWHHPNWTI